MQLQSQIQEATSPNSHEFYYLLFLCSRLPYIKGRNLITTKVGMAVGLLLYIAYFHFLSCSLNGAATRLTISIQPVNQPINQLPGSAVQGLSTQSTNECSILTTNPKTHCLFHKFSTYDPSLSRPKTCLLPHTLFF